MSTLKVDNIVAYSGTHVNGTFSGVFSGSFSSSRIDALEAFSSSLDSTFATDLVVNSLSGAFNSFTAALDNTYATDAQLYPILQATRSLELLSGSLIGITNGLMAFTAALDSTYATDEQLYQLYQATSSIHSTTSSLNEQTGSQDLVNLGISSVTGSLIGITNGLMAFTAALDTTYTTYAQLLPLLQATASLNAKTGSYAVTGSNIFNGNQIISGSVNVSGSLNLSDITFNENTMSADAGKNLIIQTSYSGTIIGTATETATDSQGGEDTNTFIAWIEGSGGTDYPTIVNVQPNWKASGPGLSVGATVASVNTLVYAPGMSVYRITLNTGYGLFQTSQEYTFTEPDTSGTITKNWIFESGSNLIVPTGGNIIGAANLTTTGSNTFYGTQTISGSFNVSGSTIQSGNNTLTGNTVLSGSINISGSNTIVGNTLMTGTNTIIGNTEMSGSINVSGSSNFHNSLFIVTGSSYFTGSHFVDGNSVFSGSINIASGSSYYRAGNKLFNYGQYGSLETQTGSANTEYSMKFETQYNGVEGIHITNNGSGFPTRLTVENTGLYNIQFSAQLHTNVTEACDFSVWFAMTGSNMADSNTDFSVEKVTGGGFSTAALNFLTPITAGDYIELYWSNTTGNGQLQYKAPQSNPNRPATPSVIITITQIA